MPEYDPEEEESNEDWVDANPKVGMADRQVSESAREIRRELVECLATRTNS